MVLFFVIVLAVILLKRCISGGWMACLVFIETIELYFPGININAKIIKRKCWAKNESLLLL